MEIAVVVLAVAAALGAGWVLWGRPLADARAEASGRLADYTRAITELAGAAKEVEALKPLRAKGEELAALKATAEERERSHAEQKAQLLKTGEDLKLQFEQLAGAALRRSHTQFIELAGQTFEAHKEKASAGLSDLIKPMRETLGRYEEHLAAVETARAENYGKLAEMLEQVSRGQERVTGETNKLATALRSSGKVAGRWGEEQCRNVLERSGLVEGTDFEVQESVTTDAGRQRPDFTLNLPGGRKMVIDVKCSLESYMAAAEAENDDDRTRHLAAHAKAVRAHATGLATRAYEKAVGGAVDFVLLYVPGENFLSAAFEHDRGLISDFNASRLVLAGPVNLIAVARTVAAMRDQEKLAKEGQEIATLGRQLYESLGTMGSNILAVQRSLDGTVKHFNTLVSQIDNRVISRARRFEKLGATTGRDPLPELRTVELLPIASTSAELLPAPVAEAAE